MFCSFLLLKMLDINCKHNMNGYWCTVYGCDWPIDSRIIFMHTDLHAPACSVFCQYFRNAKDIQNECLYLAQATCRTNLQFEKEALKAKVHIIWPLRKDYFKKCRNLDQRTWRKQKHTCGEHAHNPHRQHMST